MWDQKLDPHWVQENPWGAVSSQQYPDIQVSIPKFPKNPTTSNDQGVYKDLVEFQRFLVDLGPGSDGRSRRMRVPEIPQKKWLTVSVRYYDWDRIL